MKKKIVVAGVGSAGILALAHICSKFDNSWDIISIHDPKHKILGIGESSNPSFITTLDNGMGLNVYDGTISELDATLKLGARYLEWRKETFFSPLLSGGIAIHFDTAKLVDYALPRLSERWPEKFKFKYGRINDLQDKGDYVEFDLDGTKETCDYFIDCRGFPTDYSDYIHSDAILVNHALIHNKPIPGDWEFTDHIAHKNGWMFGIPLASRQSFGYMFNDVITPVEEAMKDFSELIKVPMNELQGIEYKFKSYFAKKFINNRIIKNGNAALFFEPIGSTSIFSFHVINISLTDYIKKRESEGGISELEVGAINEAATEAIRRVEDLISYFYHGGSNFNSKFWTEMKDMSLGRLKKSLRFNRAIISARNAHKRGVPLEGPGFVYTSPLFSYVDKAFGYNYLHSDKSIGE